MKFSHLILVILIALGAGYMGATLTPSATTAEAKKETAYERVMRTQTIRCGYFAYEPFLYKDPNTGAITGFAPDVINAIAERLKLKVEWTAEFGFATSVTDLQTGRFDITCIGFWRLPVEAKYLTYTLPFNYSQMRVYVRANDTRFDKGYDSINSPDVKIISADGQMASFIARAEFPQAKLIELPNMTSLSQQVDEVISGKADIYMSEATSATLYMKANPGKIKPLPINEPLRVFQNTFAMNMGEDNLRTMIDSALIDVVQNGTLDTIIKKYDPEGIMFLKPAKTYQ